MHRQCPVGSKPAAEPRARHGRTCFDSGRAGRRSETPGGAEASRRHHLPSRAFGGWAATSAHSPVTVSLETVVCVTTSIERQIAQELAVRGEQVAAAVALLDGGATVPFIAPYRKEATGALAEPVK